MVGEVVRHKRVEVALEAARRAGATKVVGTGPDLERLQGRLRGHREFLGRVDDAELTDSTLALERSCMPNVEEFGIAGGRGPGRRAPGPRRRRGRRAGDRGRGRDRLPPAGGDVDALAEALADADFPAMDPARIEANAQRFSAASFRARVREEVARVAPGVHSLN